MHGQTGAITHVHTVQKATAAGPDVQKPATQDRKVMPRLPAGRRKRQTPGATNPPDSTGGQGTFNTECDSCGQTCNHHGSGITAY